MNTIKSIFRRHSSFVNTLLVFLGLSLAAGALGPFGTFSLPPFSRYLYWLVCITLVGVQIIVVMGLLFRYEKTKGWHRYYVAVLSALLAAIPATMTVYGVNLWVSMGKTDINWVPLFFNVMALSLVINLPLSHRIQELFVPLPQFETEQSNLTIHDKSLPSDEIIRPDFRQLLGVNLPGTLLSVSSEDHYIRVCTTESSTLVLSRLSDAILKLSAFEGIQIHRSWWVAKEAVVRLKKQNGKWQLLLKNDNLVPVSRSRREDVKRWLGEIGD